MRKFMIAVLIVLLGFAGAALYAAVDRQFYVHHPGSFYFTDVPAGSAHDEDIGFLYEYGITTGFFDNTYRPLSLVTRQQMASYVMRSSAYDPYTSWILIDNVYFDGAYFGAAAFDAGLITYNEYLLFQDFLDWYLGLLDFQQTRSMTATKMKSVFSTAKSVLERVRAESRLPDRAAK